MSTCAGTFDAPTGLWRRGETTAARRLRRPVSAVTATLGGALPGALDVRWVGEKRGAGGPCRVLARRDRRLPPGRLAGGPAIAITEHGSKCLVS
jgi:hypothetical protein